MNDSITIKNMSISTPSSLVFRLNDKLYLRDPQHTELGRNIIQASITLIDELGFEAFTFRKLADKISSTEASIYRYFENKHRLLHYLVAWYWNWLEYRIEMATANISEPRTRLFTSIRVITEEKKFDPVFAFVDESALHRIVVNELDKTFLTKWVDHDNQAGLFGGFKNLCKKISGYIEAINPNYPYAHALVSTVLLAANQQQFFVQHLPTLSSLNPEETPAQQHEHLYQFLEGVVLSVLQ